MKKYRLLAIGNSFSEDALYYLHAMAQAYGIDLETVNLYIGGCSLERHWINLETGRQAYAYQKNGQPTDRMISIQEALQEGPWDFIVTQQSSFDSGWADTYEPFLGLLISRLKAVDAAGFSQQEPADSDAAKLFLHQTWAYETDSQHEQFMRYHRNQKEMYAKLTACYWAEANRYGLPLIPSGDLIQNLRESGRFGAGENRIPICRDGHHMNYLYGRYALACIWLKTLFSTQLQDCLFVPTVQQTAEGEKKADADPEILRQIRDMAQALERV